MDVTLEIVFLILKARFGRYIWYRCLVGWFDFLVYPADDFQNVFGASEKLVWDCRRNTIGTFKIIVVW